MMLALLLLAGVLVALGLGAFVLALAGAPAELEVTACVLLLAALFLAVAANVVLAHPNLRPRLPRFWRRFTS